MCPSPSLLPCCWHWATSGGSLGLTTGATPPRAVLGDPSSLRGPDCLALGPVLPSQVHGSKARQDLSPQLLSGRTELRSVVVALLVVGCQGRSPGSGVAGGGLNVAREAGCLPRTAEHFRPGWFPVGTGPPCELMPHATIPACASDHVDGGAADSPLLYGPPPRGSRSASKRRRAGCPVLGQSRD